MTDTFRIRWDVLARALGGKPGTVNEVPTLLLEAARRASKWESVTVPIDLVTVWPIHTAADTYLVSYRHPETGERHNLPLFLEWPGRFHFENYQRWLEDAQAAQLVSAEERPRSRRRWWRWGR
jgi:hypothetical protein